MIREIGLVASTHSLKYMFEETSLHGASSCKHMPPVKTGRRRMRTEYMFLFGAQSSFIFSDILNVSEIAITGDTTNPNS